MDVRFFGIAVLVSLIICVPMIVASVIAIILRKRPLSWILYGIGTGVSVLMLILGNVYKDSIANDAAWKPVLQSIGKFNNLAEFNAEIMGKYPDFAFNIKLYYYATWSMTIALVFVLVFAIALLLILIILMNKKREDYVRNMLTNQYQSISFK